MSDTKMLQAIISGQRAIKEELLDKINKLDQKIGKRLDGLDESVKKNGRRLDKLGLQLAYLEDDAPTREEFDSLEKRVKKVESKLDS